MEEIGHLQSSLCLCISTTLLCSPRGFLFERISFTNGVVPLQKKKRKRERDKIKTKIFQGVLLFLISPLIPGTFGFFQSYLIQWFQCLISDAARYWCPTDRACIALLNKRLAHKNPFTKKTKAICHCAHILKEGISLPACLVFNKTSAWISNSHNLPPYLPLLV